MDRIQQAYGGSGDDDEEDEEEQRTVSEANGGGGGGGARKRAAAEQQQPQDDDDRRRRQRLQATRARLPDAGALLDGRATTASAAIAVPPPPPPLPQSEQLGPPLHDGNFPFLVYVPVPLKGALADALAEIVAVAAPGVPGFEPLIGGGGGGGVEAAPEPPPPTSSSSSPTSPPDVPLHISLTRAGTVRLRQTALLVAALGRHLSGKKSKGAALPPLQPPPSSSSKAPIALLGRPRAFLNDDRTRSFLVLTALDPEEEGHETPNPRCAPVLLRAIARCDAALRELGLPPYYSDGQPHVSLASAPASSHVAMEAAAEAVARRMTTTLPPLALPYPPAALCQIGKRRHVVWGEEEREETPT
jgi:hypothetical protein